MAEDEVSLSVHSDESSSIIYDDQEESAKDYKVGGYHPVQLNEVFLNRYIVVQKLGWGHFSTVWLCKDTKFNTYVAMKVQKSAAHYTEAAYDEIEILLKVSNSYKEPLWVQSLKQYLAGTPEVEQLEREGPSRDFCFAVQLLNSFMHSGPNGKHVCMVFEILGVNLLEVIKLYEYRGIPIPLCRIISKQVLIGLDYLHRICGIIHTDLKPENVLLQLTKAQIAEIITKGMLSNRGQAAPVTPPKSISETPYSELYLEPRLTNNYTKPLNKKDKKKLRKKQYLQRKKQKEREAQQTMPSQTAVAQTTEAQAAKKKKRKRMKKKKSEQNEGEGDKVAIINEEEIVIPSPDPIPEILLHKNPLHDLDIQEDVTTKYLDKSGISTPDINISSNQLHRASPVLRSIHKETPKVDENIKIKIADLGNACWVHNHFTGEIQTRQYRSPEVILGIAYNTTADIWSFACMLFELITGDFLFEPKGGEGFDRDDDHLAQMVETLGLFNTGWSLSGKYSKKYFNKYGVLRRIKQLKFWHIKDVLREKYRVQHEEAFALADFLIPMLHFEPSKRATAQEALRHPWLNMPRNYNYRMTELEYIDFMASQKRKDEERRGRAERGELVSSPEIPQDLSDEEASSEDNAESDSEVSEISGEESPKNAMENKEYHTMMRRARAELLGEAEGEDSAECSDI
jgi:serine/threonine-protein kinase SRPK3